MFKSTAGKIKICKRMMALILMLLMLAGQASAAMTGISLESISGKKMNVYVRAFVPGSKTPWDSIGHFDLMIEGVVTFRGKTFKNPVFSYRREDSCLAVFNEADTGKYYDNDSPMDYYYDCNLYQSRIASVSSGTVKTFLKKLNSSISSATKYSGGVKCRYKNSSVFSDYKVTSVNCFFAVAAWAKYLGDDSLMEYYSGAHSGKYAIYLPKNIVRKFDDEFKLKYAG